METEMLYTDFIYLDSRTQQRLKTDFDDWRLRCLTHTHETLKENML